MLLRTRSKLLFIQFLIHCKWSKVARTVNDINRCSCLPHIKQVCIDATRCSPADNDFSHRLSVKMQMWRPCGFSSSSVRRGSAEHNAHELPLSNRHKGDSQTHMKKRRGANITYKSFQQPIAKYFPSHMATVPNWTSKGSSTYVLTNAHTPLLTCNEIRNNPND